MTQPIFHGWWLVGAGFLLQGIATGAVSYGYSIAMPPIAAEFGASRLEMMWPITASTLVSALISPFLGIAMDRIGLRLLAAIGVLALGTGFVLLGHIGSIYHGVAVFAACIAAGMVLTGPTLVSTLLARWFNQRRAFAMGLAALGTSACGFVVPLLMQGAIDAHGWRTAMQLVGLGIVLALALPVWLLVDRPALRGQHPDGALQPPPPPPALPSAASTRAIVAQANFWILTLVIGVMFAIYTSLLTNLAPLAIARGLERAEAPLLISTLAIFGIAGKIGFGFIADRIDLRHGMGAAIALILVGLGLFLVGGTLPVMLAGSVALGLATGGMLPVWGSLTAVLFGAVNYGRVMGLMSPVMTPLILAGPPFTGWIFDRSGDYVAALATFAAVLACALLSLMRIRMPAATR